MSSATAVTATRCCIVGGGPAGMMLGFLLARAGVPTVVLEKHADFLRDFRGDTVHPSTLRIMDELGLLDAFLQRPHQRLRAMRGVFGSERDPARRLQRPARALCLHRHDAAVGVPRLPRRRGEEAARVRAAHAGRRDRARDRGDGRVAGVRGSSPEGEFEIRADCTIGCDGRHSTVRAAAGLRGRGRRRADRRALVSRRPRSGSEDSAWPGSRRATSSSPSTAATTGSAPSSSPRAAPRRCSASRSRSSARRWSRPRRCSAPHIGDVRSWSDVKLLTVAVDRLLDWSKPGPALHRRRGACDVAGRRRRHQPGDPGRGRHRQPARRQAARRRRARRGRPRRGAARAASGRPRRRRRCRSRSRTTCWCG